MTTNNPQNLIVYEWEKNIPILHQKQKFDQIAAKQKKISNSQIIEKLNDSIVKADHILVRQFLSHNSKPDQLQAPASFSQVKSFFDLLKENYEKVEMQYLKHNKQKDETEEVQNSKDVNFFERNKINLSKFIKDEPEIYKKSIESNVEKVKGQEDQTGIPAHSIHKFLKHFLNENNHTKVYQSNQIYFNLPNYSQKIIELVRRYTIQVKQLPENTFALQQIYIPEEEVLQFLTFFLQSSKNLFVIYSRTEKVMSKLEKQYLKSFELKNQNHVKVIDNELKNKVLMTEVVEEKTSDLTHNLQKKFNPQNSLEGPQKQLPSQAILRRYRQKTPNTQDQDKGLKNSLLKSMTKEEKLQKIIPELFTFACKRRTRIHKGTTFDSIQQQAKFMNLQKFINFCNYLQINDFIGRQLLIEEFKLHAINRLTLTMQKFGLLLQKLIQKNNKVINKLLSLEKMEFMKKKDKMKKIIESHGKSLSKYNYQLRPVNGKDIESIQVELQQKKNMKEQMKKEKEDILLRKKQGVFAKYQTILQNKAVRQKAPSVQDSNITFTFRGMDQNPKKQLNAKKRNYSQKFNPESLISNSQEQDALWDEYESKIWKKDNKNSLLRMKNRDNSRNESHNQSILEEALSKRIQKGNKVLQKIHSSNLKYYI